MIKETECQDSPVATGIVLSQGWLDGGLAILDSEGCIDEANSALAGWLGSTPLQLRRQNFVEVLDSHVPGWEAPLKEALAEDKSFSTLSLCAANLSPQQWFHMELARGSSGSFARLNSVLPPRAELLEAAWNEYLTSESARRDMFVRLMRAEAKLDNLAQRWPGVIFSQRSDFTFHFVSPKIADLTGVPVQVWERRPQRFWQVVHEGDIEELKQQIKRAARTPAGVTSTYRIRHAQSGQIAYIMEHRQAVVSGNGLVLGYEGVWLDVTRQTIAEKRLSTAAWKETLGVLTMGLAHDFSNIMAGIHSLSESFLAQVDEQHPFQEGLALIKRQSMQASQLVHRIVQLHHGKTGERNYYDLNDIITDLVDLARKLLPRRVEVRTDLSPESLALYVDAVEFRQVILNLTLNAADAMPQGGQLTFRTTLHDRIPSAQHMVGALPHLPMVSLAVQDTGCGIPARHLSSVFDPFFTTKAMNKGSGLGLYNAHLFVDKHQGALAVNSAEGTGTSFYVWLPQADFSEAERAFTATGAQRQSLLFVGAPGEVMDSMTEFLRVHGYHVVTAHTLEEARGVLSSADYHFVGLYMLPDASHRDLLTLICDVRRNRPELKTILQVIGCNQDELDARVLKNSDLILNPGQSEEDILRQLKAALDQNPLTQ